MLKETFLAKHCLLVLCIHANFSSLFSFPLPTTVKNVCCKNTYRWLAQCILPFFFSFPLECSVIYLFIYFYRKAVRVKSKNSLSQYKVKRSPNTAECHQSQLSHIQGENGSLQRALDLLEACLYSTGFWETFREKTFLHSSMKSNTHANCGCKWRLSAACHR